MSTNVWEFKIHAIDTIPIFLIQTNEAIKSSIFKFINELIL